MQSLRYKTEMDTVAFYADDPHNPIIMGSTLKVEIVNHGYLDSWSEDQTTIRIGENMFTPFQIKEILDNVDKYHAALKAMF